MCFKTRLCQVLCLVLTVMLYSAAAQYNIFSRRPFGRKSEKLEQSSMEKCQALLESHNCHMKQEQTNVNQFRDASISIEALVNNVMKKFEQNIMGNCQVQSKELIEKIAALTTNVQQLADSIDNLRNITDKLLPGQLEIRKQMTNVQDEACQQTSKDVFPLSCTTVNINKTGTYFIRPAGVVEPFRVLCDFEDNFELGGGWTVFHRRINGAVDFYQNWTMYKNGFGDLTGEHWLGLEKLHVMTRSGRHEMVVLLEDYVGRSSYALYEDFKVGSEEEMYKLTVGNYSGTTQYSWSFHDGIKFSTFDQGDVDGIACAKALNGAWWYMNCYQSHLNDKYFRDVEHVGQGMIWSTGRRFLYSLKTTKMMLRPRS